MQGGDLLRNTTVPGREKGGPLEEQKGGGVMARTGHGYNHQEDGHGAKMMLRQSEGET